MITIIERVARQIYETLWHNPLPQEQKFDALLPAAQERYRETARAVIAAMREPTEAMLGAAWSSNTADEGFLTVWRDMIDAALAEPPA